MTGYGDGALSDAHIAAPESCYRDGPVTAPTAGATPASGGRETRAVSLSAAGWITETEMAAKIAVAVALIAAASVSAPLANADPPDQQFLDQVHSNGVGGQDDTLISYAHEWCTTGTVDAHLPSWDVLRGQGVPWSGAAGYQAFLVIQTAASRAYRVGDAQQVIKQRQILGVCVRKPGAHSIAGGLCVKIADTKGGA
jgi:hypothetical protein